MRLNALLRRFQARHRGEVTLVDLATKLCPNGPPCPAKVDGLHARPDGRHFTPDRRDLGRALHPHPDLRDREVTARARARRRRRRKRSRSSRWRRLGLAAPAYLPALMIAIGGWQHRWMDEDAFINLRIVDQIFAGHGPVFNAGERVEAATSTIWIGVLVVGRVAVRRRSRAWNGSRCSRASRPRSPRSRSRARRRGCCTAARTASSFPSGCILVAVGRGRLGLLDVGPRDGPRVVVDRGVVVRARLGRRAPEEISGRRRFGFGVILGLAPLVRPDLALMMLCFLVAWFVLVRPRRIVFDLVAIFALPVAYQIFRMGYYATVVPTTALAKDAGGLHLGQGWTYAKNFIGPYRLWLDRDPDRGRRSSTASSPTATAGSRSSTAAMLAAGLVHALYITAIGGDYMHGRLLLPAFFALALPASIAVPAARALAGRRSCGRRHRRARRGVGARQRRRVPAAAEPEVVPAQPDQRLPRRVGRQAASRRHAVRPQRQRGRRALRPGRARLLQAHRQGAASRARSATRSCSRSARSACPRTTPGRRIWVVDIGGLAEPLAARTAPVPGRPAGHRKQIDDAWYDARFAP